MCIWFFVFIIATIIYFLIRLNNHEVIEDKPVVEEKIIETGNQSPVFTGNDNSVVYNNYYADTGSETPLQESVIFSEIEELSQFNFGQAMRNIFNNEDEIQKEIINKKDNKPINSSIYPMVSYWRISDKIRLIVAASGFRDKECSRTYYFDENGKHYDINVDLDDHECQWTKLALEESYEIINGNL